MCNPDMQNKNTITRPRHKRENAGQSFSYFQKSSELNVESHDTSAHIDAADADVHTHIERYRTNKEEMCMCVCL